MLDIDEDVGAGTERLILIEFAVTGVRSADRCDLAGGTKIIAIQNWLNVGPNVVFLGDHESSSRSMAKSAMKKGHRDLPLIFRRGIDRMANALAPATRSRLVGLLLRWRSSIESWDGRRGKVTFFRWMELTAPSGKSQLIRTPINKQQTIAFVLLIKSRGSDTNSGDARIVIKEIQNRHPVRKQSQVPVVVQNITRNEATIELGNKQGTRQRNSQFLVCAPIKNCQWDGSPMSGIHNTPIRNNNRNATSFLSRKISCMRRHVGSGTRIDKPMQPLLLSKSPMVNRWNALEGVRRKISFGMKINIARLWSLDGMGRLGIFDNLHRTGPSRSLRCRRDVR